MVTNGLWLTAYSRLGLPAQMSELCPCLSHPSNLRKPLHYQFPFRLDKNSKMLTLDNLAPEFSREKSLKRFIDHQKRCRLIFFNSGSLKPRWRFWTTSRKKLLVAGIYKMANHENLCWTGHSAGLRDETFQVVLVNKRLKYKNIMFLLGHLSCNTTFS